MRRRADLESFVWPHEPEIVGLREKPFTTGATEVHRVKRRLGVTLWSVASVVKVYWVP
jgi:hypothetical protein